MAKYTIKNNSEIELLTQKELEQSLTKTAEALMQEQARGLGTFRFNSQGTISGGIINLPGATGNTPMGPEAGFAWAVQRISCDGLGTSDVLKVYRNVATPAQFLGILTATTYLRPGKGIVLRSDEQLVVFGTGLTATGDLVVNGEGLEVGELDLFKIL